LKVTAHSRCAGPPPPVVVEVVLDVGVVDEVTVEPVEPVVDVVVEPDGRVVVVPPPPPPPPTSSHPTVTKATNKLTAATAALRMIVVIPENSFFAARPTPVVWTSHGNGSVWVKPLRNP
jgi:hypothetical protein